FDGHLANLPGRIVLHFVDVDGAALRQVRGKAETRRHAVAEENVRRAVIDIRSRAVWERAALETKSGSRIAESCLVDKVHRPVAHPVQTDLLAASGHVDVVADGDTVCAGDAGRLVLLENVPSEEIVFVGDFNVYAARTLVVIEQRGNES